MLDKEHHVVYNVNKITVNIFTIVSFANSLERTKRDIPDIFSN